MKYTGGGESFATKKEKLFLENELDTLIYQYIETFTPAAVPLGPHHVTMRYHASNKRHTF